jgi:FolB domain-containing protein
MRAKDILSKIFIKDLRLECKIGVTEIERQKKQPVIINVTMWVDVSRAGETDDINQTVNYEDIYLQIIKLVEEGSFRLLELLAEEITRICLQNILVQKVEVRVEKPKALELAASAGIEIVRNKK